MLFNMNKLNHMAPRSRLVGEFFLIVLGVLAALMVDTWIQQRDDDSLRQEYIARLADDLESDRQSLDYRISFFTSVHSFGLQTLASLKTDGPVDHDAILAAYYASENFTFRPIENTYQDLQSTGNIRLLEDLALRLGLASYYRKIRSEAQGSDPSEAYREIVRGIIPWKIQAAIRENCPTVDDVGEVPTGFPPCTLPSISVDEVNTTFQTLRAHPDIFEVLNYRVSDVDTAVYLFNGQKETVLGVLAQLSE